MSEWRSVGIVVEGQPINVGGVNLWKLEWQRVGQESVELPHPSYPNQLHRMSIYQVQSGGKAITFAAGELSPNVYGFFVPAAQPSAQSTTRAKPRAL
jgi:hypothetical protein